MSLSQVLEKINVAKVLAEEDVENGSTETLSGRRGRKNRAIEELKILKREYKSEFSRGATFILTVGSLRNELTEMATNKFLCFSSDPDSFYKDLVDRLPDSLLNGKENTSGLLSIVSRHLEDKMLSLDVLAYPPMFFKQEYDITVKNKEQLQQLVKKAVNDQVGSEVVGINAIDSLIDTAIANNHSSSIVPIVVNTKEDSFAIELYSTLRKLTPNVFLVASGKVPRYIKEVEGVISLKDVTEDSLEGLFSTIKNQLRK